MLEVLANANLIGVTQFKSHVITFGVVWSVSLWWFDRKHYYVLIESITMFWSKALLCF